MGFRGILVEMEQASEKWRRLGVVREKGFLYSVKYDPLRGTDAVVIRTGMRRAGGPRDSTSEEIVRFPVELGFHYWVDLDGDVCRLPLAVMANIRRLQLEYEAMNLEYDGDEGDEG
jgi:hypothetical protein